MGREHTSDSEFCTQRAKRTLTACKDLSACISGERKSYLHMGGSTLVSIHGFLGGRLYAGPGLGLLKGAGVGERLEGRGWGLGLCGRRRWYETKVGQRVRAHLIRKDLCDRRVMLRRRRGLGRREVTSRNSHAFSDVLQAEGKTVRDGLRTSITTCN